MISVNRTLVATLVALSITACVGGGKKQSLSEGEKEQLKAFILDAPPADMPHKLDINFEGKVHMIGYRFEPEAAKPGQEVTLTYYWRCDEQVDDGYQLFTHVQVEGADRFENLDASGALRREENKHQVLGPDRWERGKIYVDSQKWTVPAAPPGPDATVYVGIYKNDARLKIVSGPNDGDGRAIVGRVKTGGAPVTKAVETANRLSIPQLLVPKLGADQKITIDGKAEEKAWASAASTGAFVDVGTGRPNVAFPVNGQAKLLWDDQSVYVFFEVKDPDIVGYFKDKDSQPKSFTATGLPMLWTKDTVEIMVDPDGDGDNVNYYELQINPQNKLFHSQFDSYNAPKVEPQGPFGHEDWDPKLKSAVAVHGTVDQSADKDIGYDVEVQIPWSAFTKGAKQLPPKHGDTWRMNLYAMQENGGVSWSPILGQGNFHKATRFGRVTFVEPGKPMGGEADAGAPSDAGVRAGDDAGIFRLRGGDGGSAAPRP